MEVFLWKSHLSHIITFHWTKILEANLPSQTSRVLSLSHIHNSLQPPAFVWSPTPWWVVSVSPPRPHPPPVTTTTGSADQWHLPVRAQLTLTVPRRLLALARLTATLWGIILFHLGHVGEGRSLGQGWHMATSHTAPPPPSPLLDLLLVSTGTSYAPGE